MDVERKINRRKLVANSFWLGIAAVTASVLGREFVLNQPKPFVDIVSTSGPTSVPQIGPVPPELFGIPIEKEIISGNEFRFEERVAKAQFLPKPEFLLATIETDDPFVFYLGSTLTSFRRGKLVFEGEELIFNTNPSYSFRDEIESIGQFPRFGVPVAGPPYGVRHTIGDEFPTENIFVRGQGDTLYESGKWWRLADSGGNMVDYRNNYSDSAFFTPDIIYDQEVSGFMDPRSRYGSYISEYQPSNEIVWRAKDYSYKLVSEPAVREAKLKEADIMIASDIGGICNRGWELRQQIPLFPYPVVDREFSKYNPEVVDISDFSDKTISVAQVYGGLYTASSLPSNPWQRDIIRKEINIVGELETGLNPSGIWYALLNSKGEHADHKGADSEPLYIPYSFLEFSSYPPASWEFARTLYC